MRAIKVYCPPGVEPPLYAFIDALDGKLKAIRVQVISYAAWMNPAPLREIWPRGEKLLP